LVSFFHAHTVRMYMYVYFAYYQQAYVREWLVYSCEDSQPPGDCTMT